MKVICTQQILLCIMFLMDSYYSEAQLDKKDSIWLQKVISGKEKIELNQETLRSIQSGTLINMGASKETLRVAPKSKFQISKDFSKYAKKDNSLRKINWESMAPGVFWLYPTPMVIMPPAFKIDIGKIWNTNAGLITFDAGELTSRKAYIHKRNAKFDYIWKEYNDLPKPELYQKQKEYQKEHPETICSTDSVRRKGLFNSPPVR